jgi:hypothetical protein
MTMPEKITLGYFYAPAPMSEYYYSVVDKETKATPLNTATYTRTDIMDIRIAELEAQIEGLNGIIESQKQTEDALIKRIHAAMRHMEVVNPDTYHLSVVYNILNGGSIPELQKPKCETCQDDPIQCGELPSLRHCPMAQIHLTLSGKKPCKK